MPSTNVSKASRSNPIFPVPISAITYVSAKGSSIECRGLHLCGGFPFTSSSAPSRASIGPVWRGSDPRQADVEECFDFGFLVADVGPGPVFQHLAFCRNDDGLRSAS